MNNSLNNNENKTTTENINKTPIENPYKDYLPENRFAPKENDITTKIAKIGLLPFYASIIALVIAGVLWFNGNNVLKTKKRVYNLNLAESINLDTIYTNKEVEWVSNNDNIKIENNVVTALKSGEVYIYAKEGDVQVSDVSIKVLTGQEALSLENHSVSSKVGDVNNISVTQVAINDQEVKEKSPKEIFIQKVKEIYETIVSIGNNEEETITENNNNNSISNEQSNVTNNDSSNQDNKQNSQDNNEQIEENKNNESENIEAGTHEEIDDETDEELEDETDNNLTFESSDDSIVMVDDNGNITSISPGTAEITVKDEYGNEDHTIITVQEDDITLYNTEYNLYEGDQSFIGYTLSSNQSTEEDIIWQSEDTNIATVEKGQINAISTGTTNIIVSVGNITKKIKVNVGKDEVLPINLELSTEKEEIYVGNTATVSAKVYPENVTNSILNWVSENENIATVDNGTIIGKSQGETTICVTTINGIEKKINVIVKRKNIEVESIETLSNSMNMKVGETSKIQYTILPNSATNKNVTVEYDTNFFDIDESNNITAKKAGDTTIKLTTNNGKSISINIHVVAPIKEIQTVTILEKDTNIEVESTKQLNVNTTCQSISWASSDNNIATIDNNGNVKGIRAGTTTITAKCVENNNIYNTTKITVIKTNKEIPLTSITLDKNNIELKRDESIKLNVSMSPSNATNQTVTWNSSNVNVATVDGNGNIKAIGSGTTKITVMSKVNPEISASCNVSVVIPINTIKINEGNISVKIGSSSKLTTTIEPTNTTNKNVEWISSDTNVVTVDASGTIKAISEGTANITVISKEKNDIKDSITITVKKIENPTPTEITVAKKSTTFLLNNNTTEKIKATLITSNKDDSIVWTSSNSNVATVDNNGQIKAINVGTAKIRASSKLDSSKYDEIDVTVRKNIIIVIGASQVTRMAGATKGNNGVKKFKSNNNNTYEVSNHTLYYFYKSGSGKNYQIGDGWNKTKKIIDSYSGYKQYVTFYIFFPIAGNDVKKYKCNELDEALTTNYMKDYYSNINKIKSSGYSIISYVVGVHPVNASYISKEKKATTKVVINSNKKSCYKNYRSNRKYNKFNQLVEKSITDNYASQLNYKEYLTVFLNTNVKDGNNFSWKGDWKKNYATVGDGVHWTEKTTKMYVGLMLNGANV